MLNRMRAAETRSWETSLAELPLLQQRAGIPLLVADSASESFLLDFFPSNTISPVSSAMTVPRSDC